MSSPEAWYMDINDFSYNANEDPGELFDHNNGLYAFLGNALRFVHLI